MVLENAYTLLTYMDGIVAFDNISGDTNSTL